MGFQIQISFNFTFLLVNFGKVLCSSTNELQQNSNAYSREDYIPQILTVLLEIHCVYILQFWLNGSVAELQTIFSPYKGLREKTV